MSQFPTQRHLASWAGMCPGKEESAGKRRSGKTREGSKRLRSALTESARAAARSKGTYLAAHYARLRGRRGSKKAAVAVGRSILVICYHAPERQVPYEELGEDYFDRRRSGEAHANHDGAVELVSERRPDVVLLDLEMPGAGGGRGDAAHALAPFAPEGRGLHDARRAGDGRTLPPARARKEAEEGMRRSEENLRLVTDSVPALIG